MSKKLMIIIGSLVVAALSVILLLVFLVFKPIRKPLPVDVDLSLSVNDISIGKGDVVYDYFSINDKNATILIETDKTDIIEIDENKIIGIGEGEVTVSLCAENRLQKITKKFIVEVYEKNYQLVIIPVDSCDKVDADTIIANSNSIQLRFELYYNGEILNNVRFNLSCEDENVTIDKEFINFIISLENDCNLKLSINEYSLNYKINIVCNF